MLTRSCAALALTLATGLPALAQRPAPDTLDPLRLPAIEVTVLRTPFQLRALPYAVAVVGHAEIQRAQPGLGLDEALGIVPGVQVDNRYNYALGERVSIRGFGARAQFGVRGVKVLVDGVPATMPDGQTTLNHVDLGFLRRAEVIRGPASALYGNAAGGVIQLETELPPEAPLRQEIGLVAGADDLRRMHSTTGGRSGRMSYALNVARLTFGGYRDFGGAENTLINARVGYAGPQDRLHVTLAAVDYDARNPGSLSDSLLSVDRSQAYGFNRLQRTGESGRHAQLGAVWTRDAEAVDLEIAAYALSRDLENPIPPSVIALVRAAGGVRALLSAEGRLAGRPVRWAAGAEADLQRDDRRNFENDRGARGALVLSQKERVTGLSTFAQVSAEVGPGLRVIGAARYDRMRFRADDRLVAAHDPDDSGARTMTALSPSAGVSYDVADGHSVYANVATAFETPTTTELANRPSGAGGFNPRLEPQRVRSFEVGARGRAGAVVAYDVAVYRAELTNALIPFEVPDVPGRQFFRNAGSAVHRGVEIGASVAASDHVRLRGAYSYIDARFDEYATAESVFDGNRVPGVAPHRLEGTLSLDGPGGSFAELDGRYVAAMPADDENAAFSPAYTLFGARAGLDRLRLGALELAPFVGVTNLFDRDHNTSVVVNAFGGRYFEPGPGRSGYVGATLAIGAE